MNESKGMSDLVDDSRGRAVSSPSLMEPSLAAGSECRAGWARPVLSTEEETEVQGGEGSCMRL